MTKFEEMRLRAIKFQELTKCCLFIVFAQEIRLHQGYAVFKNDRFFLNEIMLCEVAESEWMKAVESIDDARFPSLLEAQGWIAVETALPEKFKRVSVLEEGVQLGHGAYIDFLGNWTSGLYGNPKEIGRGSPVITHWKPLEVFPQPFQDTNV